jgi:hypothetical protein
MIIQLVYKGIQESFTAEFLKITDVEYDHLDLKYFSDV